MLERQKTKILIKFFFAAILFLTFAFQSAAQQNTKREDSAQKTKSSENIQNADVSITANVTARELRFEVVPNPTVEFTGKPERITVWEADRQNLPQQVEPGVTYRNIGIQLRIASRFADIERIVAEALGEIPVSDEASDNQTSQNSSVSVQSKREPEKSKAQPVNNRNKPRRK
jgi:hypothetical protein